MVDIPEGWNLHGYPQQGQVPHDIASPARNADGSFDFYCEVGGIVFEVLRAKRPE